MLLSCVLLNVSKLNFIVRFFSVQGRNSTRIYLFADLQYVYLIALRLIHMGGGA